MTDLRTAAQQALEALKNNAGEMRVEGAISILETALAQQAEPQGCATEEDCTKRPWCRIRGECLRKQAEPDHETRAELAEQQVVQLAEERDHYRNLWQKAQQAEPVEPVACCDLEERKALSSVKLPCDVRIGHGTHRKGSSLLALVVRSRSLYQMAKSDDYYGYASRLAVALWEKHYKDIAPQWKPLDDLMGVLTQIDNMASGLTRLAQQAEPVAKVELMMTGGNAGLATRIVEIDDHLRERLRPGQLLYTAPPQRKPLTAQQIDGVIERHVGGSEITDAMYTSMEQFARAVEKASWEKNHG